MTPKELVVWSFTVVICVMILSATGIQDWISELFGSKRSRAELEKRLASLESRMEQLERKP